MGYSEKEMNLSQYKDTKDMERIMLKMHSYSGVVCKCEDELLIEDGIKKIRSIRKRLSNKNSKKIIHLCQRIKDLF